MDAMQHGTFTQAVGSGNELTGFADPQFRKPDISDEEMLSAMNIPPRDQDLYPDLPEADQIEAGSFLSKLNLVAATYDGNLQAMVWDFYRHLSKYLTEETKAEDLIALVGSLDSMKEYLLRTRNPILFPEKKETPEGGQEKTGG